MSDSCRVKVKLARCLSLECGGPAPLWSNLQSARTFVVECLPRKQRQAAADQSGAGPPHSKETPASKY